MGTVDSRFSLHFYTTPPLSEFYPHAQVIEKWKKMENLLNMLVVERNWRAMIWKGGDAKEHSKKSLLILFRAALGDLFNSA